MTGKECCNALWSIFFCPPKAFFVSLVEAEVDFAVSAVTGWMSHLDKHLQRKTNDPTRLHCLCNKRDKVADNLPPSVFKETDQV